MDVTRIELPTKDSVFLLDNFFAGEQLIQINSIVASYTQAPEQWQQPEAMQYRRVHTGESQEYRQLEQYLRSAEQCDQIAELTDCPVWLSNMTVWIDLPGTGPLLPHRETAGEFLVQVFIGPQTDNTNGTTFYADPRRVLVQLPYRYNFGWLFEGQKVLHGRQFGVAAGLTRAVVMMWYNRG